MLAIVIFSSLSAREVVEKLIPTDSGIEGI